MKKGWLKRFLSLAIAVLLVFAMSVPAAAAESVTATAYKKMETDYYKKLTDQNGAALAGNPSLAINKFVNDSQDPLEPDVSKPIRGIGFKYKKVGDLYQIQLNQRAVMTYGVDTGFARIVGIENKADYVDGTSNLSFYKDYSVISSAMTSTKKSDFADYLNAEKEIFTSKNGSASNTISDYGLYLVAEWSVSGAEIQNSEGDWEPVAITQTQAPFVISLPAWETVNGQSYWNENVVANIKNSTSTAQVEKKIVTGTDETLTNGNEAVDDTDLTTIGDTVRFRLKGTVPVIPATSSETMTKYILTDHLSRGLDADINSITVRTAGGANPITLTKEQDFTVRSEAYSIKEGEEGYQEEYAGGQTITIEFTSGAGGGLDKLTKWAQDGGAAVREVYFYYPATVNDQAVIGEGINHSGNPNEVKLTYKVGEGAEIHTDWDKVAEFTFGIDITKELKDSTVDGSNSSSIQFVVYREVQGAKNYYTFTGGNGVYTTPGDAADKNSATVLNPAAGGKIQIKGLDEGTYYVEEIATVPGYNLLKDPLKFEITADQGTNGYVGSSDQYLGTINSGNQTGKMTAEVVNTKGFVLPATGGAGIWGFVIGGMVIIAIGCIGFVWSRKRQLGNK